MTTTLAKERAELKRLTNQLAEELKRQGLRDPHGAAKKLSASQARERDAAEPEEITERQRQRDELAARMGVLGKKTVVSRETTNGVTTSMSFGAIAIDRSAR